MRPLSSLISLLTLSLAGVAYAGSSCIAFDANWNLLAFGFNGKDYTAGTQDKWTSGAAQEITVTGRPPFDGPNANCYLSQFTNAIYVLGADKSNPSAVHIYDATAKTWSTQVVNTGGFDPSTFSAILDHDTNVFYALSKETIYSLDMGLLKSANSSALSWNEVQDPKFGADYKPVMALAQNHVHFLNVPGVPAGSAKIFVIHYSYLQPEPQSYGNFPATHGQATSFFKETGVQKEFAFIPDDGSATYVINVERNSTKTLAGPSIKDSLATYFASTDSLVQLSSSGKVSYIPYSSAAVEAAGAGSWNTISVLPVVSSNSGSGSGSPSGTPTTSGKSASQTGGTPKNGSNGNSNGAVSHSPGASWGVRGAVALVGLAIGLML